MNRIGRLLIVIFIPLALSHADPSQLRGVPQDHLVFGEKDTQRCLKCHGMANFAFRDSATSSVHNFSVDASLFNASVHARIECQQCHPDIKEYPHKFTTVRPKVDCGSDCHTFDSVAAPYLHRKEMVEFKSSAHRSGLNGENPDSPTCTTCHGNTNPHAVQKAKKSMTVAQKLALCAPCHDDKAMMLRNKIDPQAVSSYKRSFHFKAMHFGATNTAVCQDCHTVHHILPKDSLLSSISSVNIASTCGQDRCHVGAKMNFAMSGANHLDLRVEHEPLLAFLEKFFLVLTLGTMAMLVIGIVLDVQKKFGWSAIGSAWLAAMNGLIASFKPTVRWIIRFGKKLLID